MATKSITYTGSVAVDQPTLGLHWEPGQTQDVEADVADLLTTPGSDFAGARTKVAQQAATTTTTTQTTDQQPATPAPTP